MLRLLLDEFKSTHIAFHLQGTLQARLAVEVVLKGTLITPRDHQKVSQARVDGFLDDVLDGRTVDDR